MTKSRSLRKLRFQFASKLQKFAQKTKTNLVKDLLISDKALETLEITDSWKYYYCTFIVLRWTQASKPGTHRLKNEKEK